MILTRLFRRCWWCAKRYRSTPRLRERPSSSGTTTTTTTKGGRSLALSSFLDIIAFCGPLLWCESKAQRFSSNAIPSNHTVFFCVSLSVSGTTEKLEINLLYYHHFTIWMIKGLFEDIIWRLIRKMILILLMMNI